MKCTHVINNALSCTDNSHSGFSMPKISRVSNISMIMHTIYLGSRGGGGKIKVGKSDINIDHILLLPSQIQN